MTTSITIPKLIQMKQRSEKIAAVTAYDAPTAVMAEAAGIHLVLVGDSLGMVVQGNANTLPVTMEEMLYHTRIVSRMCRQALVVGDMPFMSYQTDLATAIHNAGRFIKEAGAAAVKLEGGASVSRVIRAISDAGISVQAHIGLTPQSVHQMGGYKVQRDEERLVNDALEVEAAGAFSVVLEGIPSDIAATITRKLHIPTIGIGAGPHCDGQILVIHDLLGLTERAVPKFVKSYANVMDIGKEALRRYVEEVTQGTFPGPEHCYT